MKITKLQHVFSLVYYAMVLNALWTVSFVIGLGFFTALPGTVTLFEACRELRHESTRDRLRILPFWKEQFKKNMISLWKESLLLSGLGSLLALNYVYFAASTGLVTYVLFYLTMALFILWALMFVWGSYIYANHPELAKKEVWRNAVFIPMAHIPEMIVLAVLFAAVLLIVIPGASGLVIFVGIAAGFMGCDYAFTKLLDGLAFRNVFTGWHRAD